MNVCIFHETDGNSECQNKLVHIMHSVSIDGDTIDDKKETNTQGNPVVPRAYVKCVSEKSLYAYMCTYEKYQKTIINQRAKSVK